MMEIEEIPPNIELLYACADLLRATAEFPPCGNLIELREAVGNFVIGCCYPRAIIK